MKDKPSFKTYKFIGKTILADNEIADTQALVNQANVAKDMHAALEQIIAFRLNLPRGIIGTVRAALTQARELMG